jgi:hypothetical protein
MTEMIEPVNVGIIAGGDSSKCPFDCNYTCTATNDFERVDKMGDNLKNGVPTICYKKTDAGNFENNTDPIDPKKPRPSDDDAFPNDWGWAAHHLIPVGSLKHHPLREYLEKDKKVSCDAGYNVNGAPNGKWLIGSAEMQANLKDDWVKSEVKKSSEKAGINMGDSLYSSLSSDAKKKPADALEFKKWVFDTMFHYKLQFHDSHSNTDGYNDFVTKLLNKVTANLERWNEQCPGGSKCKAAGKKPKAPHRITHRLDHISQSLDKYLSGAPDGWRSPIFTSEFSRMFADEFKKKG